MYQSISLGKTQPDSQWHISSANFCYHLSLLKDTGWTTICAYQQKANIKNLFPKTVLVTFDDGYIHKFPVVEAVTKHIMSESWFFCHKKTLARFFLCILLKSFKQSFNFKLMPIMSIKHLSNRLYLKYYEASSLC